MISHPWRAVPLFRVALPFTTGIGSAFLFRNDFVSGLCVGAGFFILAAALVFFLSQRHFRWYVFQGLLLQLIFYLQGFFGVLITREELRPLHYTKQQAAWCKLRLLEDPSVKGNKLRATALVEETGMQLHKVKSSGKLLCYFRKDSITEKLHCNEMIVCRFNWHPLPSPDKKGEFNFRLFMERRQVYGKLEVKQFRMLAPENQFSILSYAFDCRRKLLSILHSQLSGQEYAVAAALLIGEDDEVSKSLMAAFTATGTLHVLSVSGMHVGLIYMLLALILGRFENKKGWRIGYFILLYAFLWSYALITGLSAPVVRSAMMLSLVLSGKLLERKSPVLNTLTGSFLLLMVVNPFWLSETGFQLSYLAVFGIMSLHPLLLQQLEFSRLCVHRIWELVSVSLCAQIITVPVGLYYFGQFPNYFLPGNMIIIPISTLAIYGGILALVTSAIPFVGAIVSYCETWLLKILNCVTLFLGELPGAVSYPGKISLLNCLLLYGILYLLVKWLSTKSASWLQKLLIGLIVWTTVVLFRL